MLKYRKKKETHNKLSLLSNKSKWSAAKAGSLNFETCLSLSRKGGKEAEVAQVNAPVEKHKEHLITISAVEIVGKLQLVVQDKAILTISEPGTFSVKFTATADEVDVLFRCAARTDACAKIVTFKIQPVKKITAG